MAGSILLAKHPFGMIGHLVVPEGAWEISGTLDLGTLTSWADAIVSGVARRFRPDVVTVSPSAYKTLRSLDEQCRREDGVRSVVQRLFAPLLPALAAVR